jgi:micrococcal nuclease
MINSLSKKLTVCLLLLMPSSVFAHHCGLYEYKAKIVRVYDGDTIWADIDLGFNVVLRNEPLRLHRIDAPEVRGEGKERGIVVHDMLAQRIEGKDVVICTIRRKDGDEKRGSFHRYLAEIWLGDENLNDWLLENDLAVPSEG